MNGRKSVVIYDLDSTIANTLHRWHLSPMRDPDSSWEKYSEACMDDEPMPGTVRRMQLDHPHHQVHICSGRSATALLDTQRWLELHVPVAYDVVRLRPAGNTDTNVDLKVQYINILRGKGLDVVLFYEDWGPAAEAIYEQTGVPVLGINPFYPEEERVLQQAVGPDGKGGGL